MWKLTEHSNTGVSDGKDHLFDASRFDRCGKNYQDGFLKNCKYADNNEETCQSAEENQDWKCDDNESYEKKLFHEIDSHLFLIVTAMSS